MLLTFSNRSANLEGIAFVTRWANAVGSVIVGFTYRIDTALVVIDARIFTFLTDTCKSSWTIGIDSALWFALLEGISLKSWRAGTDASISTRSGDGIETTR